MSVMEVDAFGLLLGLFSSLSSLGDATPEADGIKGVPQFNPILVRTLWSWSLVVHSSAFIISSCCRPGTYSV